MLNNVVLNNNNKYNMWNQLSCNTIKKVVRLHQFHATRTLSTQHLHCRTDWSKLNEAELDLIEKNVILRKHQNNVPIIRALIEEQQKSNINTADIQRKLQNELDKLPNMTHPRLTAYTEPHELMRFVPTEDYNNANEFSDVCKRLNMFRMDHLGNYTGHKSYYLLGVLAMLEQALVQYALQFLKSNGFQLMSVPDILPNSVINGCGMPTEGERTQVYKLDSEKCLSGTSEMALAGFFANKIIDESDLPVKVAAVSRCYRAETSGLQEEKGIYRVHQFTKVEMFAICSDTQSESLLDSFKDVEVSLYKNLELNFRLIDMPPSELGSPAYQKYDIETWMPGRQIWGEISSCSNCTDYQAKRLNIQYRTKSNKLKFAHTVNGTAAAIPRLLISIIESKQIKNDKISIPAPLSRFIKQNEIYKDKSIPETKLIKYIKS